MTFNDNISYRLGLQQPIGESGSQYKTEEYTLKLNRFRGCNLTYCWGKDPF